MEIKKKCLGKDAEISSNDKGGLQSKLDYSFHLLDAPAMMALAEVLEQGAKKYARDNWRLITVEEHLNHALTHIFAHMAEDKQDDHLEHAFCRLMMAVAMKIRPDYLGYMERHKQPPVYTGVSKFKIFDKIKVSGTK